MPYYKEFCAFVHDNSPYKVHLHNCGSILPLIPMLADCGVDILNPVQISADNMAPADVKKAAGNMTLWGGGADTQRVLCGATPDEVAAHVKGLVNAFKPGGRFVFAAVHNIQGNVPPENVVAAFDAAYEAGPYPNNA
jgi:uroporphyrinogen-III decarboxylase